MHPKKSEAQIGKESFGLSSSFRSSPSPPLFPLFHSPLLRVQIPNPNPNPNPNDSSSPASLSTPHKRPAMIHPADGHRRRRPPSPSPPRYHPRLLPFPLPFPATTARTALRHLLRRLHLRLRLLLLLSFPSLYLIVSAASAGPGGRSTLLDFLSAIALSFALLLLALSLNSLPPLPSLRLLLSRSSSLLPRYHAPRPSGPVLWSIGGDRPHDAGRPASGLGVQVYSNGDAYEGEFHDGRCSGSGVYYYYMSGRYEGDWVDEKYDGYGVETWARGSRYRGQYRQGLRHGFGVYRFYTGDVYAGEWSSGQSHGSGAHTCEDGSRYVGEFKLGVKHGLGHYHFRQGL